MSTLVPAAAKALAVSTILMQRFHVVSLPLSSGALHNRSNCSTENCQISPHGALLNVLQVHLHPVIEIADGIPPTHLPVAGYAWTNAQFPFVPHLVADEFMRAGRPRSYQTHIAHQHAPELRQLIE